jgi:DNA-binding response OmpR family regulator
MRTSPGGADHAVTDFLFVGITAPDGASIILFSATVDCLHEGSVRETGAAQRLFTIGAHTVDLGAHTITGAGSQVRLTPMEWQILRYPRREPG